MKITDAAQSPASFRAAPFDLDAHFLREPMAEEGVFRFGKGDIFLNALKVLNAPTSASAEVAYSLENRCKLNQISLGAKMTYRIVEGKGLESFKFPCGALEILHVRFDDDRPVVHIEEIPHKEMERIYACKVTKNSSMIGSASREGISEKQVIELTGIFRSDIDFNNDIFAGDELRLWVREIQNDSGGRLASGKIIAALFILKGKEYWGIQYGEGDKKGFYDKKGKSLKKSFLKSPLPFLRVTSGFTMRRFHPIHKKIRPHYGVDFGAPTGTAVMAAAKGRVVGAGWLGTYGKIVKIEHHPGLLTLYAHLSKVLVKNGQRVKQGEIIGRVGSTGNSTGPHLHYGMTKNDKWVDPMKVKMETTATVSTPEFKSLSEKAIKLLTNPVPGNVRE